VKECIAHLCNNVMKFADPRPLVKSHPLVTLGATVVAGFVAATMVTPAKGESLSEKLSHFKAHSSETKEEVAQTASIRSMIVTFLMTTLMNMAKDAFTQWSSGSAPAEGSQPDEIAYPPYSEVGEDSGV
jgi:hypothetical protein